MKALPLLAAIVLAPWLATPALAATGCAGKIESLEVALTIARADKDLERTAGLDKAIARVRRDCNDGELLAAREERVAERRRDVEEDRRDLLEAERDGDWGDIEDARRDLKEAEWELQEAEAELAR